MGSFIARQPNGLLCRHSSIVGCVTDYNMTDEDYIQLCMEQAREDAKRNLELHVRPFGRVREDFYPANMSQDVFDKILKDMEKPANECNHIETSNIAALWGKNLGGHSTLG